MKLSGVELRGRTGLIELQIPSLRGIFTLVACPQPGVAISFVVSETQSHLGLCESDLDQVNIRLLQGAEG